MLLKVLVIRMIKLGILQSCQILDATANTAGLRTLAATGTRVSSKGLVLTRKGTNNSRALTSVWIHPDLILWNWVATICSAKDLQ